MTDPVTAVTEAQSAVTDAVDAVKAKVAEAQVQAAPQVAKAITWRDRYLNFVSAHPKTVSVILAVAVVWAVIASIRV